ncbi:MAG: outer membrane beta-barrel protein [Thermoguttaceae bacterium]|jgi:hypothetical protein
MKSKNNLSFFTALTLALSASPVLGLSALWAQSPAAPASPPVQQGNSSLVPTGSLDVDEFLNQNVNVLESEMSGDFFDRVKEVDNLPLPSDVGNIPEPATSPNVENSIPLPEVPVPRSVQGVPDPQNDGPVSAEDSKNKLPTTKGLPNNPQTGNYARYGHYGPSLRRDIPIEAYGQDGYGNPFIGPAGGVTGMCGRIDDVGYLGPFENVRFYSRWNECDQELLSAGALFVNGGVSAGGTNTNDWPIHPALGTDGLGRNDSPSDFGMNQLYLSFGKKVNRCGMWSIGAQVDLLYGTDYIIASSLGLESDTDGFNGGHASRIANAQPHWSKNNEGGYKNYGLAMPQAFAEIYAPWLSGFDIKLGHFYAPMGHESVQAANNFFYTHSYSFSYGMPHTLTGLLGDLKLLPGLSVQGGFSQGWDTWAENKGSLDVIGGMVLQLNPCSSLSFFLHSGDAIVDNIFESESGNFLRYETEKQTAYSLVYQRRFFGAWTWVLEHDFGSAKDGAMVMDSEGKVMLDSGNWYSVVNYIYRDITPNMTLGFRFEWFKDRNYTRTINDYAVNELLGYKWEGDNLYDFSLGLNWRVCNNVTLRPEVRYDYSDAKMVSLDGSGDYAKGIFDGFTENSMWTVGGDLLVEF